jgi:hypothetical protein
MRVSATCSRRTVVTALAAAGAASLAGKSPLHAHAPEPQPDFGPSVFVVDPRMPAADIQRRLDSIFREQERSHFTDVRHAVLFKPGRYAVDVNVGFFTQIAGLGLLPGEVTIDGHVHAEADWANGMALVNFWRGVENMSVSPPDGVDRWAVSQAAPYRRMHLQGDLALDDGGWSSGGFTADCHVEGTIRSGTQQQWFTRSSAIGGWHGANWNMMFMGVTGAPPTSFPTPPVTTIDQVPLVREKPFLHVTRTGEWQVFVPALRREASGTSWSNGSPAGTSLFLSRFFIAKPDTPVRTLNAALAAGRHLLFTPGVYRLSQPLRVARPNTVLLGLGLATLLAENGSAAIRIADVPGVTIAGLLIDAGPQRSAVLVEVGERGASHDHSANPTLLADLFFRVGGAAVGRAETCLEINSRYVIGDHLWIWRADHGDRTSGRVHVGWNESTGDQGLVVNGSDVTIYGLFVEHFQKYQTLWRGERGRTYFYQNELPYDPPNQAAYMAGATRGWAAYKVADDVRDHRAVGLGVYANFTADPSIVLENAIKAPKASGVSSESVTTISLGGGKGTIAHLVNGVGDAARPGAIRQTLTRYPVEGNTR